jgi:hypothetical protein
LETGRTEEETCADEKEARKKKATRQAPRE